MVRVRGRTECKQISTIFKLFIIINNENLLIFMIIMSLLTADFADFSQHILGALFKC